MNLNIRPLVYLLILISLIILVSIEPHLLPDAFKDITNGQAYLIGYIGLGLAISGQRSRAWFLLIQVLLIHTYITYGQDWYGETSPFVDGVSLIVLLIGTVVTTKMSERPIFSSSLIKYWIMLVAQIYLVEIFHSSPESEAAFLVATLLNPSWLSNLHPNFPVALIFYVICIFWLLWHSWKTKSHLGLGATFSTSLIGFVILEQDRTFEDSFYISIALVYLVFSMMWDAFKMAFHDQLTGLPNRRAWDEWTAVLRRKYFIAIADIDNFKSFNDTYGHDVGDQVLKMVASKLSKVKAGGRVARFGGEEFVILFTGIKSKEAYQAADQVRKLVADSVFHLRETKKRKQNDQSGRQSDSSYTVKSSLSVTVSIGMSRNTKRLNAIQKVMKAADVALYDAKQNGKNQVVF